MNPNKSINTISTAKSYNNNDNNNNNNNNNDNNNNNNNNNVLNMTCDIELLQKVCLLGCARILRRVLDMQICIYSSLFSL